jgi:hypothetical protein
MPTATACAGGWIVVDAYSQEFSHDLVPGERVTEATANPVAVASCLGRRKARAIFRQKV